MPEPPQPAPLDPLLRASAVELAGGVRRGRVSAVAVVEAHITRLQRVNPRLNALVAERFAAARAEARAADERVRSEPSEALPPLLGVPFTVKESLAVTGLPNSGGLVARGHLRAAGDATVVARLRAAGAIPLGVTNTSELCMWMEASNRLYGRTRNPYDPRCTPGGSSGGEAALVGAGAAPFGMGSDIGGSIRMPAAFCGVFGLKPSGGRVPNTGGFPLPDPGAMRLYCTGPLTRRAADLWPLLRVLSGPDGVDPSCAALPWGDPETVDPARLRVLVVPDDGRGRVHPAVAAAQERAAAALRARGAAVERVRIPAFRDAFGIWATTLARGTTTSFSAQLGTDGWGRLLFELARWPWPGAAHTLPALGLALIERFVPSAGRGAERFLARAAALRAELDERLGGDPPGVLLYPPHPVPAPRHHAPLLPPPLRWVYTALFNALELPVVVVPLGLERRGRPVGVQVVAAHAAEHVAVAVAQVLEETCGGWVPPAR